MSYKTVYLNGKARWARLKEDNRDMGDPEKTSPEVMEKLKHSEGNYTLDLYGVTRKDLEDAGIPLKGLMGQLFKENAQGEAYYKCKRPHMIPEKEEPYMGPPRVVKFNEDGTPVDWDWDTDGLLGNDSDVRVKFTVWVGTKVTKVTMEAVAIKTLVPYEAPQDEF